MMKRQLGKLSVRHLFGLGVAGLLVLGSAGEVRAEQAAMRSYEPGPRACRGLDSEMRGVSLLDARHILGVERLADREGKQMLWVTRGAKLALAPHQGDSTVLLQRLVRCQRATSAVGGESDDALLLPDVKVRVVTGDGSFVLHIESAERKTARRILDLARKAYERQQQELARARRAQQG
jgi:hypothetical protein